MDIIDFKQLIDELLKNKRIANRVSELNLSENQIIEALPILLDMSQQQEDNNDNLFLTSFYVTDSGAIKRMEVLSSKGKEKVYLKNVVTKHIYNVSFDDHREFKKTLGRKEVMQKIVTFFKNIKEKNNPQKNQGLFIYGDHGVGKTFILKRIAKKIAEQNHEIGYVLLPDLVNYIKKTFGNNEEYENVKELLKNVEYLFIDDIGGESITHWFRDEFLWLILNYRAEKEKVTFFSSNYSLDNLMKVEAKTQNQKYQDYEKAKRIITKIQFLSSPILVKN